MPIESITELFSQGLPQHQRIIICTIGAIRKCVLQKSNNFNCKYLYDGVSLEKL